MATKEELQKYIDEKEKYDNAFNEYQKEVERWNSLTPEQRHARNIQAERQRRFNWSLGIAALVCYLLYKEVGSKYSGEDFWLYWGLPSLVIVLASMVWSNAIGLIVRAALFGAIAFVVAAVGFSALVEKYAWGMSEGVKIAVSLVVSLLVFCASVSGSGMASAKPIPPKPPTKPL